MGSMMVRRLILVDVDVDVLTRHHEEASRLIESCLSIGARISRQSTNQEPGELPGIRCQPSMKHIDQHRYKDWLFEKFAVLVTVAKETTHYHSFITLSIVTCAV